MIDVMEIKMLAIVEQERFIELETVIERGLKTFVDVGNALMEIRDSKLYREDFHTFEDYCRERWNMERRHAYRLIDAAEAVGNVSNWTQILPTSESQARPLTSLPADEQSIIWQQVVETAPNGKITAAHVQAVVDSKRPENIHISDDSYEWYTPAEYIDAARVVMGSIDLDPASSEEAQVIVKASVFYTKDDDGLSKNWFGNVFVNPPYCMPDIEQFIDRVITDYNDGEIESAIILTNNCTDAGWFHRILNTAGIACFTKGRVKFWGPNSAQARQGQTLFYLGDNPEKFRDEFSKFGIVVRVE